MIAVENLSKSYGGHVLFDGVTFQINSRERVGLVGRNGHGKTTLFRIIAGETLPDDGGVSIPKNYRIGYVRQEVDFTSDTVLEEGILGLPENEKDAHWKVEKLLNGLGFSEEDYYRSPHEFSGGFQVRLNLVKVLAGEPDLLLLDEPTNYLDITSIRWIIGFLNNWPRELLVITHDRGFMDQIVTHTLGLHRQNVRKIPGNTEKYYAQIAQEEEIHEKTRINDEKRRKEIQLFISRFRAKARLAGMVQSRIKTLSKMEKKDKLADIRSLEFSFRHKPSPAKHVMTVDNVSFSYGQGAPLIRALTLGVKPGDRIGIIGKNGKGKTTLLKLLAGRLKPDTGNIVFHPSVTAGVFEQTNVESLEPKRSVEDEILYADTGVDRQLARNICGAMMFSGDDALKKIGVLSGGEKSRVMLGKILATPVNLLLLDEPTNHLDMDACDALLAAIDAFDGTVIMVTHNEMFLHALAQRLIVFQQDTPYVFEGGYERFLETVGWDETQGGGAGADTLRREEKPPLAAQSKKEIRRLRSEIVAEKSAVLKPVEKRMAQVEKAIEELETELARLNEQMVDASSGGNGAQIADISRSLHRCQQAVEEQYNELEILTVRHERQSSEFENKLAQFDG